MLMLTQTPLNDHPEFSTDGDYAEWNPKGPDTQDVSSNEPYLPSPEEIAEHCREIRRDWSEAEYRKRSGQPYRPLEIATTPCRISFSDLFYLDNS